MKRLRMKQVIEKVGLSRSMIYLKIKNNEFPKPRKDGRMSYWLDTDIDEWIKLSM